MSQFSMQDLQNNPNIQYDYPYLRIGYNTLLHPASFTDYCFYPNCPNVRFPSDKYSKQYTQQQINNFVEGITRYAEGYRQYRDDDLNACPVFNSNMKMPKSNFF